MGIAMSDAEIIATVIIAAYILGIAMGWLGCWSVLKKE